LQEAAAGDPARARRRLALLERLLVLGPTADAIDLSRILIERGAIPNKAEVDALHIAIAAVNGIEYLLTWNCTHIANARMRSEIEAVCCHDGPGSDPVEAGFIESLALPGGNVTGITNLTRELGGKRLELLKEAAPKLARVAVLYEPANPNSAREVKELLLVAARALRLTLQPWEVRATDGFEKVFAALNK
jgi:hypothetical protein